ncbi:hypothetical protein E6H35_04000 [Candidatus Bathyarchaeota archaeon]|nr:MAG: hypothetical protein E6H35_04000 [Candidatus Bathyarchaeota archaeon]
MQPVEVTPVRHRPEGLTILGALAILAGVAGLVAGGALLIASLAVGTITSSLKDYLSTQGYPQLVSYVTTSNVATILASLGVFSILVGLFWFAEGIGVLSGKGWAWNVGIAIFVLSIINSIIQVVFGNYFSAIGIVIDLGIIYYLMKPSVRAFFGKTLAPTWKP